MMSPATIRRLYDELAHYHGRLKLRVASMISRGEDSIELRHEVSKLEGMIDVLELVLKAPPDYVLVFEEYPFGMRPPGGDYIDGEIVEH